jgi:hypothetical protein
MIEERRCEAVHSLQHPIGGSGPAARFHLRYGALKRARRADRLRSPGFEWPGKAMRHEMLWTERQRDIPVGAGMKIEHGSRLRSEIDDRLALQDLQDDDLVLHQR